MAYHIRNVVIPIAGALMVCGAATVWAQSQNGLSNSAVRDVATNRSAASLKGENNATGKVAVSRSRPLTTAPDATPGATAPLALALEDTGPAPAANPEPLSVILIGGALAGLYRARKHLV